MSKATFLVIAAMVLVVSSQPTNEIDVVTKLLADLKGSA
jgi:hypothetical protein